MALPLAGVGWSGAGQYGSAAVRFLAVALLALQVPPSDFGLLGLVMAFVLFSEGITELGLVGALVQGDRAEEPTLSTAFWVNLGANTLAAGVAAWFAEPIMTMFGDKAAAPILTMLSVTMPITGLSAVPRAILLRDLAFRRSSLIQLSGEFGFGITGLALASAGAGVWSLAGAVLTQRVLATVLFWRAVNWRPRLCCGRHSAKALFRFGGPFMLGAILNRGMGNLDYFIVGRWLGTEALGFYSLAFQLSATPMNKLVGVFQRVSFPALSRLRNDPVRMREAFRQGLHYVFAASVPCSFFMAVLGPWFIEAAYGEEWAPSQVPLQVLAIGGFFYAFDLGHSAYLAIGNPGPRLWLILLRISLFSLLVWQFGLALGIQGVAFSLAVAVLISGLVSLSFALRRLAIGLSTVVRSLLFPLKAVPLALIPVIGSVLLPVESLSPWVVLLGLGFAMSILYSLGILLQWRNLHI